MKHSIEPSRFEQGISEFRANLSLLRTQLEDLEQGIQVAYVNNLKKFIDCFREEMESKSFDFKESNESDEKRSAQNQSLSGSQRRDR